MTLQDSFNAPIGPSLDGCSEDDILELLRTSQIGEIGLHPNGSNYVFVVRFETDLTGDVPLMGVYKPQAGERPLRDFEPGLHRREHASYLLSRILGWPSIPPTVIRDGPHGEGSFQLFIHANEEDNYFSMRNEIPDKFETIAGFDIVVNNADRKGGACLRDADGKVWAIDHGLTFNPDARVRTVMFEFCGQPINPNMVESLNKLRPLLSNGPEGYLAGSVGLQTDHIPALRSMLSSGDMEALKTRIDAILKDPVFPLLDEYYNVPWPLV